MFGRHHIAGQQHFHRVLARHVARQRHHRRRAEQADIDAGRGEFGGGGSDRQIATGDQLAAGGGGGALHGGDHRLRQVDDLLHHGAAGRHDVAEIGAPAVAIAAARGQLLHVMAGAEGRPVGRQHDGADRLVRGNIAPRLGQRGQQRFRQAVARRRAVEDQDGDLAVALAQQHGCGRSLARAAVLASIGPEISISARYLTRRTALASQRNKTNYARSMARFDG